MEPIIVPITREHEYDITLRAQSHEYDITVSHGTTISDVVLHRPYHSSQKILVPMQSGIALSDENLKLGVSREVVPSASHIGIKTWSANMRREGDAEELFPSVIDIGIGTESVASYHTRLALPNESEIGLTAQSINTTSSHGLKPSAGGIQIGVVGAKTTGSYKIAPTMSSIELGADEIDLDVIPNEVEVEIIGSGINYTGSGSTYAYCYAEINNTIYTDATAGIIVQPGDTINIVACSSVSNTTALGSICVDGVQYSRVAQKAFTVPSGSPKIIIGLAQNVTSSSNQYTYAHASTTSDLLVVAITGSGASGACDVSYSNVSGVYKPSVITFDVTSAYPTLTLGVMGNNYTSTSYGEIVINGSQVKKVTSWNYETYSWAIPSATRGATVNLAYNNNGWSSYGRINALTTTNDSSGGGGGGGGTTTINFTITPVRGTTIGSPVTFGAESGMTWASFVSSAYNTNSAFTTYSSFVTYLRDDNIVCSSNSFSTMVSPSDTITANHAYYAIRD